jgi:2-phosphosulfolactate phosphatase
VLAAHRQSAYRVRFDWGLGGADAVAGGADVTVVVDVLSFTTTLSVALDAGVVVLPYRWRDETARGYAAEHGAVLAVGRSQARPGELSLSPLSLRVAELAERLVLPSPNGSSIVSQLAARTKTCSAACLRNASAVAGWIAAGSSATTTVAVIAGLVAAGWGGVSAEADAARCGYESVRDGELEAWLGCASGCELVDAGYRADVEIAAEVGTSETVPLLVDGHCFLPAGAPDGEGS